LVWLGKGWLLLAGGHCSEVAINTGLTVSQKILGLLRVFISEEKNFKNKILLL
jgi:hypothetical protein